MPNCTSADSCCTPRHLTYQHAFCDWYKRSGRKTRCFVPILQAPPNKADAALEYNPSRFEKWPLSPILRTHLPVSDCATPLVPEHHVFPAGPAIRPFLKNNIRVHTASQPHGQAQHVTQPGHFANAKSWAGETVALPGLGNRRRHRYGSLPQVMPRGLTMSPAPPCMPAA